MCELPQRLCEVVQADCIMDFGTKVGTRNQLVNNVHDSNRQQQITYRLTRNKKEYLLNEENVK
jgi:hypothetical protein